MKRTRMIGKVLIVAATAVWLAGCGTTGGGPDGGMAGGPGVGAATHGVHDPAVMAVIRSGKIKGTPEQISNWLHQTTYHYKVNEYAVTPKDYNSLNATAALMTTPLMQGKVLVIEGNTDERGTRSYNMALGQRRAAAVQNYLQAKGVPLEKVRTVTYGFERPIDNAHNEQAWAQNRRVHLVVMPADAPPHPPING